jgi:hypothetical protein
MIHYVVTRQARGTIHLFLAGDGRALARRVRVILYDELFRMRRVPTGTWIFSDLERLDREDLERAARCWDALERSGHPVKLFNHPLRVRRRYELLRALEREGFNDYAVYRVDEGRVPERFPVFLRVENDHQGPETELIHSPDALREAVAKLEDEGRSRDQRMIVEYCAEADAEGRFRKYGAFLLDGRILPRHLLVNKHWVAKGRDREACNETIPEQIAYNEENPHAEALKRAFEIARIDYGRVDYGIVGGRIQVYEINTNPQITVPGSGRGHPDRARIKVEFAEKFVEIVAPWADVGGDAPPTVPVRFETGSALQRGGLRAADALRAAARAVGLAHLEPAVFTRMRKAFRRWR